mmetsp:Transcript_69135/g.160271  ORF Transcript_69135/g.160271 Transcript_69135/m.160271 type:complete len:223 (-) Transcript_69135:1323-1991(-)
MRASTALRASSASCLSGASLLLSSRSGPGTSSWPQPRLRSSWWRRGSAAAGIPSPSSRPSASPPPVVSLTSTAVRRAAWAWSWSARASPSCPQGEAAARSRLWRCPCAHGSLCPETLPTLHPWCTCPSRSTPRSCPCSPTRAPTQRAWWSCLSASLPTTARSWVRPALSFPLWLAERRWMPWGTAPTCWQRSSCRSVRKASTSRTAPGRPSSAVRSTATQGC